jgi:predicted peptidase
MKRSKIFLVPAVVAFGLALAQGSNTGSSTSTSNQPPAGGPQNTVFYTNHIKAVTAITEVFGDGQQTTAAVLEYDTPIKNSSLSKTDFTVSGRTVTKVYANTHAAKATSGRDGRFVVLELNILAPGASSSTATASLFGANSLTVNQAAAVQTVSGKSYAPTPSPLSNTRQTNLVVDDFQQFRYTDPTTGLRLDYNLYIPKGYSRAQKYPLVLFLPDASVTGDNPYATLTQGLGAVVWASPASQAKHPAFVLAPQPPVALANDNSQTSDYADVIVRLIRSLEKRYSIDNNRLYTTGQSGGCMTSIALNIKYPDLFAASFLVAGQWDPTKVPPMAKNKLWIVVSQDDSKAYPGMNAIVPVLQQNGAKVTQAVWNAKASAAEFQSDVEAILKAGPDSNVYYVSFDKGTVIPAGQTSNPGAGHIYTWYYAYTIEGIRDWLFRQHK